MRDLNKDIKTRDTILFGDYSPNYYKYGGIRSFDGVSGRTLRFLVDNSFADPENCQNSAPSLGEFLELLECHSGYYAHGYAVSDTRSDYRVTIEGLEKFEREDDRDTLAEFVELNRGADELIIDDQMYSWYD